MTRRSALEEALLSICQLTQTGPLPADPPDARLWTLLSLALAQESLSAAQACIPTQTRQETRQTLSLLSRGISRQAASLAAWLPPDQPMEVQAVWYALLSMETAASLARSMEPGPVRQALDFLLPEYLDALYRLSNLLALEGFGSASDYIGGFVEIMPGRSLAACHRHPFDGLGLSPARLSIHEQIALTLMTALEEEKQRFFHHAAAQTSQEPGRGLFLELAMLSGQYACQYASLLPPMSPLFRLAWDRYAARYLYASCAQTVPHPPLRAFAEAEEKHTRTQCRVLSPLLPEDERFPESDGLPPPLSFGQNKGHVRDTLAQTGMTALRDGYAPVNTLPREADYFRYQRRVRPDMAALPSCRVIRAMLQKTGMDDRFEIAPHPVAALRDRTRDPSDGR